MIDKGKSHDLIMEAGSRGFSMLSGRLPLIDNEWANIIAGYYFILKINGQI